MHLFLSPHLDDVVFSCGGLVHQLTANGESVVILTVTSGDPPLVLPDSSIVRELHKRWAEQSAEGIDTTNIVHVRRVEDTRAAQEIGAPVHHLAEYDCIYRTAGGAALYPTGVSIFENVQPQDYLLSRLLKTRLPFENVTALYVPLGVGHHVDHQITRDWGLALADQHPEWAVKFYEEYPYIRVEDPDERALPYFEDRILSLEIVPLSEADVLAKIAGMRQYTSQLSSFWKDADAMAAEIRGIMTRYSDMPIERYWVLQ